MATNEIKNGCGSSIEAVLASNQKRRRVLWARMGPFGASGRYADTQTGCFSHYIRTYGKPELDALNDRGSQDLLTRCDIATDR